MNNQNFRYLQAYKSFDNGYGRVSDWRSWKTYKIGDKVEVYESAKKHGGKQGTIVIPTDIHKIKENASEMVKVKFEDGSSDYLAITDIFRINSFEKKKFVKTSQEFEAEKTVNESIKPKIDYNKKFAKKLQEVNAIIDQAKKDDVIAIEFSGTWESPYQFDKVWIDGNKLKVAYTEEYTKKKVDEVNLKRDAIMDYEEAKYMFSWIKRCIAKGYREERKQMLKDMKKEDE